jgi:hypothetical protein
MRLSQAQAPAPLVCQAQVRGEEVIAPEPSRGSRDSQELEHEQPAVVLDGRDLPVEALPRLQLAVGADGETDEVANAPGPRRQERRGPEQTPAR